jgi:environmental stress-induced protein Ves
MTEEIYVHPPGSEEFLFRASMAALSQSGPFSLFPGIDRSLILLEGKPIKLNDSMVPLLSPVKFPGEEKIMATIETEGRDLNLMCRRGKVSGEIHVLKGQTELTEESDFTFIFALADFISVGPTTLKKYDSCLLNRDERKTAIIGEKFLKIDISMLENVPKGEEELFILD